MTPRGRSDAEARQRAASGFDRNLVVLAGAGTGKTSLLVERVLVALGSGNAGVDDLAVITFTRKAAEELRERTASGLDRLRRLTGDSAPELDDAREADRAFRQLRDRDGVEPGALRRRALSALDGLDEAVLETIHGFCATLLREHPRAAGIDPAFEVDEGEHLATIREEAWDAFVADELGQAAGRTELWRRVLDVFPLARVRDAAFRMAGFGIPDELIRGGAATVDTARLFRDEATRTAAYVEDVLSRQSGMTDLAVMSLELYASGLRALAEGGVPRLRELYNGDARLRQRLGAGKLSPPRGLRGVTPEEMRRAQKDARALLRPLLEADDRRMQDLAEAIAPYAVRAREAFLRRGYIGFDGLLLLTRDLLRDHVAVRAAIRRRYRMLLIDEFQDTDPLQYEIVLYLAERADGTARDPFEAELEPGRLFVVGDPKQSIYRFRGADYAAFRRAIDRIVEQGGEALALTENFRSVPGVLEPVNRLFRPGASTTWRPGEHQPDYVAIDAARSGGGDPRVELWTLDGTAGKRVAERRSAEGRAVAEEIERLVREGVVDGYRCVTLLLRAFTDLAFYLRPLRERGIPFVVDGGREFLERPEVGHLIVTLHALVQPSDQTALLAYLRSPAAGVPDDELAQYAAEGGRWEFHREVDAARWPALARAFALLREIEDATANLPADRVVIEVLRRTALPIVSAASFEGAQRVANLQKLAATAADLGRSGKLSLSEVIEALRAARTADLESDSPLADEGTSAVRVLTVHKAKGLENDVVIVPDLSRLGVRGPDRREFRVDAVTLPDGSRALAMGTSGSQNAARVFLDLDQRRHDEAEELRVLYVALTRARERLLLVVGDDEARAPWVRALAPWGFAPAAPPADGALLADGAVRHRRVTVRPAGTRRGEDLAVGGAPDAVERHQRAWSRMLACAGAPLTAPSGEHDTEPEVQRSRSRDHAAVAKREAAKLAGSVVHQLLERWDGREPERLARRGAARARRLAERHGIAGDVPAGEVTEILEAFVGSDLASRFQRLDVAGREVPLLLRKDERSTWAGSIDLLYRDAAGRFVVADFKTDREPDPGALRDRYAEQLTIYATAVREAWRLDYTPRTELWLLRSGEVLEL